MEIMDNLSLYENEQISAIAAWKSERPSVLGSWVIGLFGPIRPWVARAVPRAVVWQAVEQLEAVAAVSGGMADVARLAKVSDVRELRFSPMKECDGLASRISMRTQRDCAVQDLLRRTRGALDRASSLPLPLVIALRFVCRIGHCYGYRLDRPVDRQFVLAILEQSSQEGYAHGGAGPRVWPAGDAHYGRDVLDGGHSTGNVGNAVPGSGRRSVAPDRVTLDHTFLDRVDVVARRAFQERWLVDSGRLNSIAPSESRRRSTLEDVSRAMSQVAYVVGGAIGFGAMFPVVAACDLLTRGDHAGARGVRDGARAAVQDADQFLAGLLGHEPPTPKTPHPRALGPLLP
jgi:hypothetical protein